MATLTNAELQRITNGISRFWSNNRTEGTIGGDMATLFTTVQETDSWQDTNQSSYTSSLTHGSLYSAAELKLIYLATAAYRLAPNWAIKLMGLLD